MHCIKQNADQLYRVRRGNDQPFTLVVRRSPEGYELGEGKGEYLNPEELKGLRVTIYEPNFGEGFTPDIRTFGDALGFELTREHTERYGLGIYEVEVSFTIDGEDGRTLRAPLCLVVKEGAHFTAQNHQLVLDLAPIAKGERGDRGQSAYEAYLDNTNDDPKLTEGEWIASLKSAADKLLEAKGYTDSKVGELSTAASNARDSLRESLGEAIASGINTAVSTANGYADTKFGIAQGYADTVLSLAKGYSDTQLGIAKGYSDTNLGLAKGYADNGDAATLRGANNYTDLHVKRAREEAHQESELVRELAYGKSRRFLAALPPAEYKEGDEWVLTADWTTYKRGTALIAVKDSRAGIYSPEDWVELYKYVQLIEEAKRWNIHEHTFDLTQLDPAKYYAAVIQLPTQVNINQPDRYNIVLYAGLDKSIPKPPYATHSLGFNAELRWSVSANGNGARYDGRVVESYGSVSVKAGEQVMSQPYHSAVLRSEYVYLRGGYVYQCRVTSDFAPTFTLAATDFTLAGRNASIPSPVDSVTPPKSDVERLRDDMREGDRATLEGAKNAATAKAKEAVDALQLGGRNYALGTANAKEGSGYLVSEYRVGAPWVAGVDYNISFVLGSESPDMAAYIYVDSFSTSEVAIRAEGTPTQGADGLYYARYSATFRTTQERIDLSVRRIAGGNGGFRLYKTKRFGSRDEGRYVLSRVMLERGNKASDWTLAPEDTEAAIAALVQRVAALEAAKQA